MANVETTTSVGNWNFHKFRIQQDVTGGQFVNAESTLIAAGPPNFDQVQSLDDGEYAYPIGLLETFGLNQSRQLQRIFEIGSSRSYFVPGRTIGSVTLGRTFYFGPSLLRVMYAYWNGTFDSSTAIQGADGATGAGKGALLGGYGQQRELFRVPGYDYLLIDLASDLFAQPTGMAVVFKDANNATFGGFYLENCYVQGHQMTVSSGSVLIMEGVSIQYDLLVPMNIMDENTEG